MDKHLQQQKRFLTKSRFKMAVECPRKLAYTNRKDYTDTKKSNEMLQGLAEGGVQIGTLAQVIYAQEADREGVAWKEITGSQDTQILATTQALKEHAITLFEATIQVGQFLVRVDVLRKRGNSIDLIEVKSKSVDSSESEKSLLRRPEYLSYLQDIAFQTMVAQQAYPAFEIHSFLMMPDKAQVTRTTNLHKLFPVQVDVSNGERRARVDMPPVSLWAGIDHNFMLAMNVDKEVTTVLQGFLKSDAPGLEDSFASLANRWAVAYANQEDIEPIIGSKNCGNCEFYNATPDESSKSGFHECWARKVPGFSSDQRRGDTVLGLYNDRGGLKKTQMASGRYFLHDIDQADLKWEPISGPITNAQRQWMQISHDWPGGGDHYFDKQGFMAEQGNWEFPYLFLDFEGARSALPFRPGQRPSAINAFQYSLHLMHEDSTVEHKSQFLKLDQSGNPNAEFLRHLKEDLCNHGTVFHWHRYERNILNELRHELINSEKKEADCPELIEFIDSLVDKSNERMVDQSRIAEMFFFHPDTQGSSSIKKVLPALMGSSHWLRHKYSQPVYGGDSEMNSLNHRSPVVWWHEHPERQGKAIDPYGLLAEQSLPGDDDREKELCDAAERALTEEGAAPQNGGAAMMAYARLQSGRQSPEAEAKLKAAMLRYCELDTLAMVMIMQGFIHHSQ